MRIAAVMFRTARRLFRTAFTRRMLFIAHLLAASKGPCLSTTLPRTAFAPRLSFATLASAWIAFIFRHRARSAWGKPGSIGESPTHGLAQVDLPF